MKKKLIIGGAIALLAIIGIASVSGSQPHPQQSSVQSAPSVTTNAPTASPAPSSQIQIQPQATTAPAPTATSTPAAAAPTPSTSSSDTYTNVDGNTVESPTYSTDGSVPAGATAQCGDGTYSFSQHRSGTCSHHGGVADWL